MAAVEKRLNEVFATGKESTMTSILTPEIQEEMAKCQAEIVLGAFRATWAKWTTLEELAGILQDQSVRPYLASIKRSDLEVPQSTEHHTRRPNRVKPSKEQLQIVANAILTEAAKAPEDGLTKDHLIGSISDSLKPVAIEWWQLVKEAAGNKLETQGQGRGVTYRAAKHAKK